MSTEVPIGDVDVYVENVPSRSRKEDEPSRIGSGRFEEWLLALWRHKDDLMERYLAAGTFSSTKDCESTLPLKLKSKWEIIHACSVWVLGFVIYGLKHI